MATVTPFDVRQNTPMVYSGIATIDSGETATLPIYNGGRAVVRLGFPSMTGTTATFTVQAFPPSDPAAKTLDPVFRPLYDATGVTQVSVTVTDNSIIEVPELAGCYAFTIVSGGAEASARSIEVQCVGPYPTNGATAISGTVPVSGTVTANQGTAGTPFGSGAWPVYAIPNQTIASTTYSPVTSVVTKANLKSSGGNVLHFFVTNFNASLRWFQLHNKATAPAAADVPQLSIPIPAGTANNPGYVEFVAQWNDNFTTGIGWAVSTTQGTFTDAATASDHTVVVEYT